MALTQRPTHVTDTRGKEVSQIPETTQTSIEGRLQQAAAQTDKAPKGPPHGPIGCGKCLVRPPASMPLNSTTVYDIGAPEDVMDDSFGHVTARRVEKNRIELHVQAKTTASDGDYALIVTDADGMPKDATIVKIRGGTLDASVRTAADAWHVVIAKPAKDQKMDDLKAWEALFSKENAPSDVVLAPAKARDR
jgi:hypothetical protein